MKDLLLGIGLIVIIIAAIVGFMASSNNKQKFNDANEVKFKNENVKVTQAITPIPTITIFPTQAPVTELKIQDLSVGQGTEVKSGDTIIINYEGMLTTGEIFDSSYKSGKPFETQIGVGRVIPGWDEGVIGMKVGGKRRLIIPPDKAYGAAGIPGTIPPNATLIFNLELLEIKS